MAVILLSLLVALAVADVVVTNAALKVPGLREANPLMQRLQDKLGRLWFVPKLAVTAVGVWLLYRTAAEAAVPMTALLILAYVWVVVNNWRLIRERTRK